MLSPSDLHWAAPTCSFGSSLEMSAGHHFPSAHQRTVLWLELCWESPFPCSHSTCLGFHPSLPRPEPTSHTRHLCAPSPLPSLPGLQASLAREPVLQCAGQMGVPDTRAADLWPRGTASICVRAPLDQLPLPTLRHSLPWDAAFPSASAAPSATRPHSGGPEPRVLDPGSGVAQC